MAAVSCFRVLPPLVSSDNYGQKAYPIAFLRRLNARSHLKSRLDMNELRQMHAQLIVFGLIHDPLDAGKFLELCTTSLSDCLDYAISVLGQISNANTFIFNTVIKAFSKRKRFTNALLLYNQMVERAISPDNYTFPVVLRACSHFPAIGKGKEIHGFATKMGFGEDVFVVSALVDMYSKNGEIGDAIKVFDKIPQRDVVCWSSLIGAYEKCGYLEEALLLFLSLRYSVPEQPNEASLVSALSACAHLGALEPGKQIHAHIEKLGYSVKHDKKNNTHNEKEGCYSVILGNVLIDMYSKCGCIEEARLVFDKMKMRDVFSWSGMVLGLSMHGCSEEALNLFIVMQEVGVKPNEITFIGVLSACGHAGLVEEGRRYFDSMNIVHGLSPRIEHYGCMVDLLGRAGMLREAEVLVGTMPIKPDSIIWGALLGACRIHGNVELGERAGKHVIDLDPFHGGRYVLLSNIYAAAQRWDDVDLVRKMMEDRGIEKRPGCSTIEVDGVVHKFFVGDRRHPQTEEIYAMLDEIAKELILIGYAPVQPY